MAKRGSVSGGGDLPPEIQKMSFEEALKDLEAIVQRLESGEISLEESIEVYSRGTQLKRHCEAKLRAARQRVEKIVADSEGEVRAGPAGIE